MAGGQGKRKNKRQPPSAREGGSTVIGASVGGNRATSVQDDKKESVSMSFPAPKKKRSRPTFEKLAETLLEFPGMFAPLAELFSEASRDEGVDIKDFTDKIRRVAASGEVYSPMEFSGIQLQTILRSFGLLYDYDTYGTGAEHMWDIDEDSSGLPEEIRNITPSHCFWETTKLASRCMMRTSEAICRTMIDLILINVVGTMTDKLPYLPKIQISGEVGIKYAQQSTMKLWSGRLDYALGLEASPDWYNAFAICEAKNHGLLIHATGQLVGYLAVLRECRLQIGRKDTDVSGATSDGINWMFFAISETGKLRISRHISIHEPAGMERVFRYLSIIIFKALKQQMTEAPGSGDPVAYIVEKTFDEEGNIIETDV